MSPVHAASLVDPSTHSPALMQLIDVQLTKPVIEYLVESVAETVDFAMGRASSGRGRGLSRVSPYVAPFTTFATTVLTRAEATPATVLAALVYISRARPHLSIALEEWALERVFLGALITASKYTNDSTLKNVHWALCSGVFGKRDVGRIEREFLDVLDWELGIKEADLLAHHQAIMEAASPRRTHKRSMSSTSSADFLAVPVARPRATHSRHSSVNSIPELEPSSPASSSLGSFSPATPAHSPSPIRVPSRKDQQFVDVSMDVEPSSFHTLLNSFPMPHQSYARHTIQLGAA